MVICKDKYVCDNCHTQMKKGDIDNYFFSESGVDTDGQLCLCEFCYLEFKKLKS